MPKAEPRLLGFAIRGAGPRSYGLNEQKSALIT
jgi:hypothetical protein